MLNTSNYNVEWFGHKAGHMLCCTFHPIKNQVDGVSFCVCVCVCSMRARASMDVGGGLRLLIVTFEPPHDKTNKMTCATSEDSDQPDAQADPSLRWAHM